MKSINKIINTMCEKSLTEVIITSGIARGARINNRKNAKEACEKAKLSNKQNDYLYEFKHNIQILIQDIQSKINEKRENNKLLQML